MYASAAAAPRTSMWLDNSQSMRLSELRKVPPTALLSRTSAGAHHKHKIDRIIRQNILVRRIELEARLT